MIQGLAEHKLDASGKQAFFGTLGRLATKNARLPESMVIPNEIDFSVPGHFQASGGFADVKPGMYKGCTVAVKTLRVAQTDNFEKIRKVSGKVVFAVGRNDTEIVSQQFCKEVILWNSLSHPNVLMLVGVPGGINQYQFATVSEWMLHGTIIEYIRKTATNRLELVGVPGFRV